MNHLLLDGVGIKYGGTTACENVSFCVEKGDYFVLAGCNGGGKTSLIKAILGLISFSGKITHGLARERISYIPQISALTGDFPATNFETVISGRQHKGRLFYSKEDRDAALSAMELLGIAHLRKKGAGELSGGQKQKVLLARAVCSDPDLYILDEPATALDEDSVTVLYTFLSERNKAGKTVLVVTHDISAIKQYASKIAVLNTSLRFYGGREEWEQFRQGEGRHFDE